MDVGDSPLAEHGARATCFFLGWNLRGEALDWRPERVARDIADEMVTHATAMWQAGRVPVLLRHDAGQGKGDGGESYGVVRDATVDAVAPLCARIASSRPRYLTATESHADALPCR